MKIGLLKRLPNIDFVRYIPWFFAFSGTLIVLSLFFLGFRGLNLGIDFKGGIIADVQPTEQTGEDISALKNTIIDAFPALGSNNIIIQHFSDGVIRIVVSNSAFVSKSEASDFSSDLRSVLESKYVYLQNQYVGPSISKDLVQGAIWALLSAFIAISLYLWIRFDWQYGVVAVIALLHDVLISALFLSISWYEVNIASIAAFLMIIGYSVNDTVVLFDQVRENVRKFTKITPSEILNKSINQVLSRSLSTSLTLLFVLVSLFFFGGWVLKGFSFLLIVGIVFGTYSSICIALGLLLFIGDIKSVHNVYKEHNAVK